MKHNETSRTGPTRRLAEMICETSFAQLPAEVVDYAKRLTVSCLGGMVAGSELPISRKVASYVRQMGGNPHAVVTGAGFRTSVENAAFATAIFAHATEYEDDSMPEGVTTYSIIPPIFALAEWLNYPGERLIEAFVVGQEVQARMGIDFKATRRRGIINLPFAGIFGVVSASAKMLGLSVEQTEMALSLTASQAGGLIRQLGSMAHFFESGSAARDGLAAAMLAAEGLRGDWGILEGPRGLYDVATGGDITAPNDPIANWGSPFRIMEVGIKRFPCCYQEQRIIDGVLDLKHAHNLRSDQIESVQVEVNPNFVLSMKYPNPIDAAQARFSIHHSVAVALMDDRITMGGYTDEAANDPAYAEFRNRVKLVVHDDWEWGATVGTNPVTIHLKDGSSVSIQCARARGWPPELLSWDEVRDKYFLCTERLLGTAKTEESLAMGVELDRLESVGKLADTLLGQER